jgi:hypothetical protein
MNGFNGIRALWQSHRPLRVAVGASADACISTLTLASKPSQTRLHLRDVFFEGRRYYFRHAQDGFTLTSDSRSFWGNSKRVRTTSAVRLHAHFQPISDSLTWITLTARMNRLGMIRAMAFPLFIALLLGTGFVNRPLALLIGGLITLFSWAAYRFEAAYQANEMVYFVRKALEDLPNPVVAELPAGQRDDVIDAPLSAAAQNEQFMQAWERYFGS